MKYYVLFILVLALFIAGCSTNNGNPVGVPSIDDKQPVVVTSDNGSTPQLNDGGIREVDKISPTELFLHDTEDDCWITYQSSVYDLTDFLPKHPGTAAAIVPYCGTGTEFEDAFTTKHGTKNVPVLEKMGVYKGQLE